ncbi:MAG: HAD family hydrolase [Verrucomicrobiota bacterium]|nr:HAD family hydrolase [Verrucomicrobiota bacterium]
MSEIQLIATDLDGTLIGNSREFHLFAEFRDRIAAIRLQRGCVWAICTGRTRRSFKRYFAPMLMVGLQPDYVIVRHAYICGTTSLGSFPHLLWNMRIACEQWVQRSRIRRVLDRWHRAIVRDIPDVETLARKPERLWVALAGEEHAALAADLLNKQPLSSRYLTAFRRLKEVDARCVPFTKGLALSELARRLRIPAEGILAIGNGHNDASTLDGAVSRHTGCPMNSEPEIMWIVHKNGGHIASKPSLAGVIEILDAYESGNVRSALPDSWRNPETFDPGERLELKRRPHHRSKAPQSVLLVGAAVCAAPLAFAQFDLLPFSGWIRMPFELLIAAIRWAVEVP